MTDSIYTYKVNLSFFNSVFSKYLPPPMKQENVMGFKSGIANSFVLFISPFVTSLSVAITPSFAASFASSSAFFETSNYSLTPQNLKPENVGDIGTSIKFNTSTLSVPGATAVAEVTSDASFNKEDLNAIFSNNYSQSVALGQGSRYLGLAQSQVGVFGNFFIPAGQTFSFDFFANLNLLTKIDLPRRDSAIARGEISLLLVDATNNKNTVLDSFTVTSNLITRPYEEEGEDFLAYDYSDNIDIGLNNSDPDDDPFLQTYFGGNQEFSQASFIGSYQRTFTSDTWLSLIETKTNEVRVEAPEPSSALGLFLFFGLAGIGLKVKSKLNGETTII